MPSMPKPPFPLGVTLATPGALAALAKCPDGQLTAVKLLARHVTGIPDAAVNDLIGQGRATGRLLSSYTLPTGTKLWIITEADRSATTILLPEEY